MIYLLVADVENFEQRQIIFLAEPDSAGGLQHEFVEKVRQWGEVQETKADD